MSEIATPKEQLAARSEENKKNVKSMIQDKEEELKRLGADIKAKDRLSDDSEQLSIDKRRHNSQNLQLAIIKLKLQEHILQYSFYTSPEWLVRCAIINYISDLHSDTRAELFNQHLILGQPIPEFEFDGIGLCAARAHDSAVVESFFENSTACKLYANPEKGFPEKKVTVFNGIEISFRNNKKPRKD